MKTLLYYTDKIKTGDILDKWPAYADLEDIGRGVGLGDVCYGISQPDKNVRLVSIDIPELTWTCTDTLVGMCAIYLDKNLVAISLQTARKDDVYYFWKDRECFNKVKEYLLSLQDIEEPAINFINWDESLEKLEELKKRNDAYNLSKIAYKI